jgi:5-dehydro-4-deoxyglucarate dehydratase
VKFGVVIYNRNVCKLSPESLLKLTDRCPNLIGFKDGIGDIELMALLRSPLNALAHPCRPAIRGPCR